MRFSVVSANYAFTKIFNLFMTEVLDHLDIKMVFSNPGSVLAVGQAGQISKDRCK